MVRSSMDDARKGAAPSALGPDDDVCLCFHVPLRKVRAFVAREDPPVASLISECLGAGTGCRWCVPVLRMLHEQHAAGQPMRVPADPASYAAGRRVYRSTGRRDTPGST